MPPASGGGPGAGVPQETTDQAADEAPEASVATGGPLPALSAMRAAGGSPLSRGRLLLCSSLTLTQETTSWT